jgi:DNA recombination protein RmuC
MVQHVDRLRDGLQQAGDHYNKFIGSLEQNVLASARRFKELGVSAAKDIPDVARLDLTLDPITRDELANRLEQEPAAGNRPS